MTQEQIQHLVEGIKRVTAENLKSPEASRQFLIKAGIMEDDSKKSATKKTKK